jgi:putative transcriptional regulator
MADKRTRRGRELEKSLREALAHSRGEIALPTRMVNPMPPDQIKAIRKSVAKSPREFERRFGVPARTLEGWEQGRKLDVAGRVLLTVIQREPEAVERAVAGTTTIDRRQKAVRKRAASKLRVAK